jgi:Protein of unknown function (DUF2384)
MVYQSHVYRMIVKLFELWTLNDTQQLKLLGFSEKNVKIFDDYKLGLPISEPFEIAEREAHILAIHKYLLILFSDQPELAYQWMNQQNKSFDGTPVAFVALKGLRGLIDIRSYLSNICQH